MFKHPFFMKFTKIVVLLILPPFGLTRNGAFLHSLHDPGSSIMTTREWFGDLLVVELKLSVLWNLLVQPHVSKFHRWLGSPCLHALKLSSDSCARQVLQRRLQKSSLQTSGDPQHPLVRESGLDFFFGVMEKILLHTRPLFSRQCSSFCIFKRSWGCRCLQ